MEIPWAHLPVCKPSLMPRQVFVSIIQPRHRKTCLIFFYFVFFFLFFSFLFFSFWKKLHVINIILGNKGARRTALSFVPTVGTDDSNFPYAQCQPSICFSFSLSLLQWWKGASAWIFWSSTSELTIPSFYQSLIGPSELMSLAERKSGRCLDNFSCPFLYFSWCLCDWGKVGNHVFQMLPHS